MKNGCTFAEAFTATMKRGVWISSSEYPDIGWQLRIRWANNTEWVTETRRSEDDTWEVMGTHDDFPLRVGRKCIAARWCVEAETIE